MSDNMEREKNERLNARKMEEEKMKRELTGIGIYEPGITYNQMKEILGFLNESEDTSNVAFTNKNMQKGAQYSDNECLSETRSDTNASQECTELSRPSYAYKTKRASPTVQSEHKTVRYSSSPEPSPLFEMRNPTYRRKSSDSDELTEKQHESTNSTTHSTNRFYSLRSGNCPPSTSERKTDQGMQDEITQKLERWRLNPLDICIDENDVPLQQPCRPLARERAPFGCCKEASTSEQHDQLVRIMSQHLKEMAELRYSSLPSANSVFQWGSPIQVGTANANLDRKPLTDSKTEQIKAECTYRDSHERISKRKASSLIANLNNESSTEDECDNRYDCLPVKKKKVQSNNKSSNVEHRTTHQRQRANHETTTSNVVTHQEHSLNDNNNDVNLEDEHIESLNAKKNVDEENKRLSPELTTYPKRIVPPKPKARLSLPRHRKGNVTSKPSPKVRRTDGSKDVDQVKRQKNNTITSDEIYSTLQEDWNSEQEEEAETTKDVEIRPLSVTKEVQSRLHRKRLFNNTETVKETRATIKEGENNRQRNKEKRLKIHEEEKKEEELSRISNGSWEHQLLSDDEDEPPKMNQKSDVQDSKQSANVSTSSGNVRCPICNKLFSHNEIEDHAADCEQFEANDEVGDNDANQLECTICNNYKTSNGVDYEQHVHQCINNKNNKKDSYESKTVNIDSAPTSSFKNYKPISEQKDSEIDYLGQFSSNSKTHNTGRKRKR